MLTPRSRRPTGHAATKRRGQSAVEMALILPIFLTIIMGIIEFSRAFYSYTVVSNAVREGARYGIMHPSWVTSADNADPNNIQYQTTRLTTGLGLEDDNLQVIRPTSTAETSSTAKAVLTIEYPDTTYRHGDRIKVSMVYRMTTLVPFPRSITLGSTSTMRIE